MMMIPMLDAIIVNNTMIDYEYFAKEKGRLGRETLLENGADKAFVDKLTDQEAWNVANELINTFFNGRTR